MKGDRLGARHAGLRERLDQLELPVPAVGLDALALDVERDTALSLVRRRDAQVCDRAGARGAGFVHRMTSARWRESAVACSVPTPALRPPRYRAGCRLRRPRPARMMLDGRPGGAMVAARRGAM